MESANDTIVALATPLAPAPRGVVRLSGPRLLDVLAPWIIEPPSWKSRPFRYEVAWRCPEPLGIVPLALYLWPDRRSYTGEPGAELHLIGAPPIVESVLECCLASGARLADPGEFTLRAFLNGRIDLTQAEAVLGVIEADDEEKLKAALRQLAGGIGHPLEELRSRLVALLADLEAGLDFVDEPIEFISAEELRRQARELSAEIDRLLEQLRSNQRSDSARRVVLVGRPNAGKSSLLNALCGRETALVEAFAGTTRDPVTTRVSWRGAPIELVDTAGHEAEPDDLVAQAAQGLRSEFERGADLRVACVPADGPVGSPKLEEWRGGIPTLLVRTKADLRPDPAARAKGGGTDALWVSSLTGEGLEQLRSRIVAELAQSEPNGQVPLGSRCRDGLERARKSLRRVERLLNDRAGEELVALELRESLEAIGELVGAFYTEELLDAIFGRFCIGK